MTGLQMTWSGADGSIWPLTGHGDYGVRLLRGVRGLTMPSFDRYTSTSPTVPGARLRGARTQSREVFWPLQIHHPRQDLGWREYESSFWRSLSPSVAGTWTVTLPDGSARSLRLRLVSDNGGPDYLWHPEWDGVAEYGVDLVADDPFWHGQPVRSPAWGQEGNMPFTGPGDAAPPFFLSAAQTLGNADLANPGDVEAWPTWEIHGPATYVSLSVGGEVVEVPFPLLETQTLVIDTAVPIARLDGQDVTSLLGRHEFAPIPPGGSANQRLEMSGTGWVQASFTPLHYRAY